MTDKEKLNAIRAEVEEYISAARKAHTNITEGNFAHLLSFIDSLQEKPISEELEEAANSCSSCIYLEEVLSDDDGEVLKERLVNTFKAGAQWQKEQFEKNRIEHCDSITEEQYNLETGFIDYYIDKYNRMPTFLDAIEYGMKKAMEE